MVVDAAAEYLNEFRARGAAIADACTRCGDCFRACPMVEPAGIGDGGPGRDDRRDRRPRHRRSR